MARSLRDRVLFWWYENENIFNFDFTVELLGFNFIVKILTFDLSLKLKLPKMFKDCFVSYGFINKKLTENKIFELQLVFVSDCKTGINFYKNIHCDHSKICMEIYLFGFNLIFQIYDNRHWDSENNEWL